MIKYWQTFEVHYEQIWLFLKNENLKKARSFYELNFWKNILPPTRNKSRISLWKLITFDPNKQIQWNKQIQLKLSNRDNNKFAWV